MFIFRKSNCSLRGFFTTGFFMVFFYVLFIVVEGRNKDLWRVFQVQVSRRGKVNFMCIYIAASYIIFLFFFCSFTYSDCSIWNCLSVLFGKRKPHFFSSFTFSPERENFGFFLPASSVHFCVPMYHFPCFFIMYLDM